MSSRHWRTHSFSLGQYRERDGSSGRTIFDSEFAQDAFNVLADRPGACAEDDPDLIIRFTLGDPSQNLRFARGETQRSKRVLHRHRFSFCFHFGFSFWCGAFNWLSVLPPTRADVGEIVRILVSHWCFRGSFLLGSVANPA